MNNFTTQWHDTIVGAFNANDKDYLIEQIQDFIAALGRHLEVDSKRVEAVRLLIRTTGLPRISSLPNLSAEDRWVMLYQSAFDHLEAVRLDEQMLPLWPELIAARPEQPEDEDIEGEVISAAIEKELPQGCQVLSQFFCRRGEADTPLYRMIEKDPEHYRLLVALLVMLGTERFEAFLSAYASEDLHIPGPDEFRKFDRDRQIWELHSAGVTQETIADQFGLSAVRVGQIVKAERKGLRFNNEATMALLDEINMARDAVCRALVAQELHRRRELNREPEHGAGGGRVTPSVKNQD